jgi:hypothetical protein
MQPVGNVSEVRRFGDAGIFAPRPGRSSGDVIGLPGVRLSELHKRFTAI